MTDQPTSTPPVHGDVVPEDRAKQGRRGVPVLAVLGASLALIVVIYVGLGVANHRHVADTGPDAARTRTVEATKTAP